MINEMGGDFLQWLRGFYYVAKKESVTLAAMEIGRNQPTISHHIKCLENEFNITLFDRSGGKMALTPEGEIFLEKTISIFEIIKEMRSELGEDRFHIKGNIVIATTHAVIHYFLPQFIVRFKELYPNVQFEMEGGGLKMILEKLESAEADFGIANLSSVPETLTYHELFRTSPKLIAPKNNIFFSKKGPTLRQIAKAPFILFPSSSTITPLIERKFAEKELDLKVVLTLNNFEDVKKYVSLGVGVSILDGYTLSGEDENRLDIYNLDRYFKERNYGLIMRKRKYLSPQAKAFVRSVRKNADINRGHAQKSSDK